MTRRIVVASIYTLFVLALLVTWPSWTTPPVIEGRTVITGTQSARWLLIFIPLMWGWVAFYSEDKWRKRGLIGSALLFVVCFLFIWYHDNAYANNPCISPDPGCSSSGWFR